MALAAEFDLTPEDLSQMLPSGRQTRFANRVGWASSYLKQAGLLEFPARAVYRVTERGRDVLRESPPRIDIEYLRRFPEFVEFRFPSEQLDQTPSWLSAEVRATVATPLTPDELMRAGYQDLRRNLAS